MLKGTNIWLRGYIESVLKRRPLHYPVKILFATADHFEPAQRPEDPFELQIERVRKWIGGFEKRYGNHIDSTGKRPMRSYFFPQEQYNAEVLDMLAEHCSKGFGEVDIHIHHDRDNEKAFVEKIERFKEQLASHHLLARDSRDSRIKYGFVHGNWALDNSRKDGRWCGLNNEITLLKRTGCYADFTLPCAPTDGQTRKVNSIYYADDDPSRPKSHDTGRDIHFGGRTTGDLLLIQGPLALNFSNRTRWIFPRIENGDVSAANPMTAERIRIWINQRISVRGKEDFIFVKVHAHALKPRNFDYLLSDRMEEAFTKLETLFNDGEKFVLHYVTTREMANIVNAFNDGLDGTVEQLRDYRYKWLMNE